MWERATWPDLLSDRRAPTDRHGRSPGTLRFAPSHHRARGRRGDAGAATMATPLDPATQAAVGAFAGLVEVTVQQVRMPHLSESSLFGHPATPEPARR